jgi:hypothetical protein
MRHPAAGLALRPAHLQIGMLVNIVNGGLDDIFFKIKHAFIALFNFKLLFEPS